MGVTFPILLVYRVCRVYRVCKQLGSDPEDSEDSEDSEDPEDSSWGILQGSPPTDISVRDVIPRTIAAAVVFLFLASPSYAQVTVAVDVAEDALSWNSQPKLALAQDGSIYLAFVKRAGGVSQIFLARSPDGRTFRLQQVTREAGDSRFPSLAVGQDGRVHLTWTQYTDPVGKVYYSQLDRGRWSTPVKLSEGTAYAGVPAVVVDLQQEPHVVWYGIRPNAPPVLTRHGSIYEILYRGRSSGRWSEPEFISPGIPDSINPGLAIDGRGALHSAWYQSDLRVYHVRHAQRRTGWEEPQTLTTGGGDAFAVTVAAGSDNGVYVVWERRSTSGTQIYLSERHARWSGQQAISSGRTAQNPSVTVDATGRVYVAWDSEGAIYLRRKNDRWLGVEQLTRGGKHSHPVLSTRGPTVDLAWVEDRGTQRLVRFTSLTSAPTRPSRGLGPILWIGMIAALALILWQYLRSRRARAST